MSAKTTRKSRRAQFIKGFIGVSALVFFAGCTSACGTQDALDKTSDAAGQVQDGASKAGEIVNGLPTSPEQVSDKLKASLQTVSLTLNGTSCSLTNPVTLKVNSLGNDWPTGPYISVVEHSTNENGDYKAYKRPYKALNPAKDASPRDSWEWNCVIPPDELGWYRLSIVHLDENGNPDKATKWTNFQVVN